MNVDLHRDPAASSSSWRTEIAVIGSGPGGSITACLLAEAGRSVLLIEEGPFLQLDSCEQFSRKEIVQKYRNGGITVAMGKPKVSYAEARCVGGGSEINSGLYHRTPPDVLDEWRRDFDVTSLSQDDLRPCFEASERDLGVTHLPCAASSASLKLRQGAEALGWEALEAPRWFKFAPGDSKARGTRQSMTQTFVPRALAAGCRLLADTRALKLRRHGGRWRVTAIRSPAGGAPRTVEVDAATVFVCAGAVQTPALLRRSGIRRNIGHTLHAHPTIKVVARFGEIVNASDVSVPVHQVRQFSPRYSLGGSISSPPFLAMAMLDHPAQAREVAENWQQCGIYYAMSRGGVGSVRCVPFFRDPLVRYRLNEQELADLSEALGSLCRCLFAAGAVALYPGISGGPCLTSPCDISKLPASLPASRTSLVTLHLFSSCPMGENKERAAVDSFGRVHGLENLHIADGSVLCGAPGVNPQGTIMAIARRNALAHLRKF